MRNFGNNVLTYLHTARNDALSTHSNVGGNIYRPDFRFRLEKFLQHHIVHTCLAYEQFRHRFNRFDVGIPETPTPLESAKVSNGDTPPP